MSCFSIEEGKILSGWLPHCEPHDLSEALACCPAEMPAEHRSYIQLSSWQEAPTGSNAVFQCAKKKTKNRCCPTSQLGQKELRQSSMGQQNTVSVTSFINDFTRCFAVRSQKQEGFKWVTKAGSESAPSGGITNSNPLHCFRHSHPEPGEPAWDQGPEGQESTVVLLLAWAGWPPATRRPSPSPEAPRSCVLHWDSEKCSGVALLGLQFQCFSSILKLEHRLLTHSDEYCALGNRNANTSSSAAIPLCQNLRETALKTLSYQPP